MLGASPADHSDHGDEQAAVTALSARSRSLTERANAHLSGESPRAAEVRRRNAERASRAAPSPRRSPRQPRMTTDEFIAHLGIATGSPDVAPRVRPSWDRSPLDRRAAWVADHSVRAPSSFTSAAHLAGGTGAVAERTPTPSLLSPRRNHQREQPPRPTSGNQATVKSLPTGVQLSPRSPGLSPPLPQPPQLQQLVAFLDEPGILSYLTRWIVH